MELSTVDTDHRWRDTERARSGPYDAGVPRAVHRYEIISELGGGAMSTVQLAHDTAAGRVVAIKSLAADAVTPAGAQRRFAREAAILARLHHPNVVRAIAVDRDGDAPIAIVTEYVRGRSLRDVLADGAPLPIDRVVRILRDVASALAYAHAQGIVHCDVKPANILLDEEHDRAVLIDFGIACETGARPDADHDELTVGTPAYMAPEQIEARAVDPRTDVYALCIVAWELLAGRMPWLGAELADVLHRQRYEPLPDLALVRPDIPIYLLNAINGGLAKDPARRWRDAGELLRHLSPRALSLVSISAGAPALDATMRIDATAVDRVSAPVVVAKPYAVEPNRVAPRRRSRLALSTIAAVVLLALASLAPRLTRATDRPRAGIDPGLDSMLTLAVAPPGTGAGARTSRTPSTCSATAGSKRRVRCTMPGKRATASHSRRARGSMASRRSKAR